MRDDRDLLGRLDHPLAHRGLGDVDELGRVEGRLELGGASSGERVGLDAEPARGDPALPQHLADGVLKLSRRQSV